MIRLNGETAVITGDPTGIGLAALGEEGLKAYGSTNPLQDIGDPAVVRTKRLTKVESVKGTSPLACVRDGAFQGVVSQ